MSLEWIPRDDKPKDHNYLGDEWLGTEPPCTMFEKKTHNE